MGRPERKRFRQLTVGQRFKLVNSSTLDVLPSCPLYEKIDPIKVRDDGIRPRVHTAKFFKKGEDTPSTIYIELDSLCEVVVSGDT